MLHKKYHVNNYILVYNPFFNCWNVTDKENVFGSYKSFYKAFNEAIKG